MIPKIMHFIWVGDEAKRPDNCIDTWRQHHPDWEFRLWGNAELAGHDWINRRHMQEMYGRELNGVADMMRWEILYAHGGIVFDADSVALRPLDDALLDCDAFACWENEIARPGLIAAGYFGCTAANPLVAGIIADIAAEPSVVNAMAWQTVGPQRLTDSYRKYRYSRLRIYPSHYFIPQHFTGLTYDGRDPVYAHQLWGSTRRSYDAIHRQAIDVAPMAAAIKPVFATSDAPAARIERTAAPGRVQRTKVGSEMADMGRFDLFRQLCAGRRVLHVGCAEDLGGDATASLHAMLTPHCAALDGVDGDAEALARLEAVANGRLMTSLAEATDAYDVVLVPGAMEHVSDLPRFLAALQRIDAPCYFVAVRDAYRAGREQFAYDQATETAVEIIGKGDTMAYTPYTLGNAIRTHSALSVEQMWYFDGASLLAFLSKRAVALAA